MVFNILSCDSYMAFIKSIEFDNYILNDSSLNLNDLLNISTDYKSRIVSICNEDNILGFLITYPKDFRDDTKRLFVYCLAIKRNFVDKDFFKSLNEVFFKISKSFNCSKVYLEIDEYSPIKKYLTAIDFRDERFELCRILKYNDVFNTISSNVQMLTPEVLSNNIEAFAQLYLINDKAHLYSESSNILEARDQMLKLIEYIKDKKASVFYISENNNICGVIWGFPYNDGKKLYTRVKQVTVFEDFRGRRYAEILYNSLFSYLLKKNEKLVITHVDYNNKSAISLYNRLGYEILKTQMVKGFV